MTLLLESTGALADTKKLVEVLDYFACDHLAACWNAHSTCLMQGETPEQTITNLGAYVRHVRITDGTALGGPELTGEGELPLQALMNALRSVNYDGFVSLVWDPSWVAGLDDAEMILTHFAVCMAGFQRQTRRKNLYFNAAGTGQYVWKKDVVIDCTFPQVLDRMVEEGGANLSGGEKKRVCLARALLRDTELLILDEPLANLDGETAERIEDLLLSIRDRTLLVVSHQFSAGKLPGFDQVVDMAAGG